MALLNQFQTYSQKENTVTNSVLLLFSLLFELNPRYYEEFIAGLIDDENKYRVLPDFRQQVNNRGNGIIDGFVEMKASKIIIETKNSGLEDIEKLTKYAERFDKHDHKLLFHLSKNKYSKENEDQINQRLQEKQPDAQIFFYSLSYQDLADQLSQLSESYPYEHQLTRLEEHFSGYLSSSGLVRHSHHILRAMACGQSFDLNVKHQFYFDLASRGYSRFDYLGIYRSKAVRYIGAVENMIQADLHEAGDLEIKSFSTPVTDEQRLRLEAAILDSVSKGWDVQWGHRFFLLKDFHETDFKKKSKGGLFRVKYFNLEDRFEKVPSDVKEIAEELKNQKWE